MNDSDYDYKNRVATSEGWTTVWSKTSNPRKAVLHSFTGVVLLARLRSIYL